MRGSEVWTSRVLADNDLRDPDEIEPHQDGGIICLWHAEKLVAVIDPTDQRGSAEPRAASVETTVSRTVNASAAVGRGRD
jgi:hypothetical protein